MNPLDAETLGIVFDVASVVVALPAVAVLVLYAFTATRRRLGGATATQTDFGPNPDAILLMLQGLTKAVGALGPVGGALGRLLLRGLALVACLGIALAGVCWWTGDGLRAHAPWALVSASILLVAALVPSLVLTLSLRGAGRVVPLALLVFCALGLHALWGGSTQPAS